MIKANELRLGNLVNLRGDITDIQLIDTYRCMAFSDYVEYEDLEPIPLTEEILLKAGFIRSLNWEYDKIYTKEIRLWEDDNILKIDHYIIDEKHYFTTSICLLEHEYLYNCNKLENLKEENIDKEVTIQDFDYVHQLQNIHYSLTNEELEINL